MKWIALALALALPAAAVAQSPPAAQEGKGEQQVQPPQQAQPPQQPEPPAEQAQQPPEQPGQSGEQGQAWVQEYVAFVKRVQVALREHGFDPGAVNGLDEGRTQAALAQFQLSRNLPASGSMDEGTLKALGVERAAPEDRAASAQQQPPQAAQPGQASTGAGTPVAAPDAKPQAQTGGSQ